MSGSCSNLSAASCSSNDINDRRDSLLSPGSPSLDSVDQQNAASAYKRLEDENKLLKSQIDTLKGKVQSLLEENKSLRMASVSIQVRAEQEEEYISNTLLKRIEVSHIICFVCDDSFVMSHTCIIIFIT
jgi:coiled-coil domain-containing protein 6